MVVMAIYKLTKDAISKLDDTTFADRGIKERADLQRLLRTDIAVVAQDTLVIGEEYSDWEDSKRRIDLLAVDRDANLVVIELKRSDDGGHMELQAIRYAGMIAGMTFARAVDVYQAFLDKQKHGQDASAKLLEFLDWDSPREEDFARDVRIVLVAADFSRELTTTVLWLNKRELDIRCVRLKPYDNGTETIIDAQQVIPLPEAEDYMVREKAKDQAARSEGAGRHSLRRAFWTEFLPQAAEATPRFAGRSPGDRYYIDVSAGLPGIRYVYCVWTSQSGLECYINRDDESGAFNKVVFDYLYSQRAAIEAEYGRPLGWERLDTKRASRIFDDTIPGGIRSPRDQWPAMQRSMIDAMLRFENALSTHLTAAVAKAESGSA